jgi:hypothetical protein
MRLGPDMEAVLQAHELAYIQDGAAGLGKGRPWSLHASVDLDARHLLMRPFNDGERNLSLTEHHPDRR